MDNGAQQSHATDINNILKGHMVSNIDECKDENSPSEYGDFTGGKGLCYNPKD